VGPPWSATIALWLRRRALYISVRLSISAKKPGLNFLGCCLGLVSTFLRVPLLTRGIVWAFAGCLLGGTCWAARIGVSGVNALYTGM